MADTHYAASCSLTDVNAAIAAASDGDTVIVPSGSATWGSGTSGLTITKGIYLIGAGGSGTSITSGVGSDYFMIEYIPADFSLNSPLRISGFTFDLDDHGHGICLNHQLSSSLVIQTKIRIDHNTFTGATTLSHQAIKNYGMRGVVDNNTFDNIPYPIRNSSCYSTGGKYWWDNWEAIVFGKADNNIYYEDNTFTGVQMLIDAQYANRYVLRYNTITTSAENYPLCDLHGNEGGMYSSFGGEIYGNLINANLGMGLLDHRGGKFLVFMNVKTGTSNQWYIQPREESPDYNEPTTNPSPQYVNDTYYFLNRKNYTGAFNIVAVGSQMDNPPLEDVPTENREFFVGTDSFDGTVGCGYGTLASRPATCTTGVGYWATDQSISDLTGMVGKNPATPISGTLYKATATDTWTNYFTPLAYPHPLRSQYGEASWCDLDVSIDEDRIGVVDKVV